MAVVHFVRKVPLADGSLVPASGFLYFTPTARRVITGTPDVVVLPVGFQVRLVDGAADVTLEPTTGAWVWRIQESLTGTTSTVYHVTVPEVAELDDTDLVRVDPATLEPTATPEPIWETQLAGKVDVADVGAADGVAPLGPDSKVPGIYLPEGSAGTVASTDITDSTATGRAVLTATDGPAARTAIGAGTSSLAIGTGAADAMAGDRTFTKADVGLGNVDNTADTAKPVSAVQQAALDAKVDAAEKGAANGVATLDAGGKVPAGQLPASTGSSPSGMKPVTGIYSILNPGNVGNANLGSAGAVYLTPAYLPTAMSITEIWAYIVTGAAGSTAQLGYYTNDGAGLTRQALFGTVDTAAAGAKTITGAWTLPAGAIYLAWLPLGGTPTFRGTSSTPQVPGAHTAGAGSGTPFDDLKIIYGPGSQASLPATIPSSGLTHTTTPARFAVKAA